MIRALIILGGVVALIALATAAVWQYTWKNNEIAAARATAEAVGDESPPQCGEPPPIAGIGMTEKEIIARRPLEVCVARVLGPRISRAEDRAILLQREWENDRVWYALGFASILIATAALTFTAPHLTKRDIQRKGEKP